MKRKKRKKGGRPRRPQLNIVGTLEQDQNKLIEEILHRPHTLPTISGPSRNVHLTAKKQSMYVDYTAPARCPLAVYPLGHPHHVNVNKYLYILFTNQTAHTRLHKI